MDDVARREAASPRAEPGRPHRYRADLDGLRAVAVSAVLLFHYGFGLPGGFVGVDVFFVLSGYLITAIVWAEVARGTFSLVAFYERRIRRIVPALAVMLLACGTAFFFVFLPEDMWLLARSEFAAALFGTNILFHQIASDYFDADNLTLQPLLHTWSLAVEAQFYLVYPLALLALGGKARRVVATLAVAAVLSLAFGQWEVHLHPVAAFYLLPGRAWELLVGGLVAFAVRRGGVADRPFGVRLPGLATVAGLAAIAAAALLFDAATPFPGVAALLPCLGAVLVIFGGGHRNAASAWLGARPLAALGRISYSLYLWHWPVLVFAHYRTSTALTVTTRLMMLAATLGLSIASYAVVERPFIARAVLPSRRGLFAGALAASVAIGAVGGVLDLTRQGVLPFARLPPAVATLAAGNYDRAEGDCDPPRDGIPVSASCRFGKSDEAPTIAVWGNSYARMWMPGLDADARRHGVAGIDMLMSKCPPLIGVAVAARPNCRGFNSAALAYLEAHPNVRTVLLGADWFDAGSDVGRLADTLDRLKAAGLTIVVLLAPPQPDFSVPRTLALAALRGEPTPPPIDRAHARLAQQASTDIIAVLRDRFGFTVIDPATALCDATTCAVERDGRPVFFDAGHVTASTALASASLFDPLFDAAETAPPRL